MRWKTVSKSLFIPSLVASTFKKIKILSDFTQILSLWNPNQPTCLTPLWPPVLPPRPLTEKAWIPEARSPQVCGRCKKCNFRNTSLNFLSPLLLIQVPFYFICTCHSLETEIPPPCTHTHLSLCSKSMKHLSLSITAFSVVKLRICEYSHKCTL